MAQRSPVSRISCGYHRSSFASSHVVRGHLLRVKTIRIRQRELLQMTMTSSAKQGSKRSKWALDFAHKTKQDKNVEIPSPPGYTPTGSLFHNVEYMRESDSNHLIIKKSWDLALAPLKQVPMNLFIMYMAGNSISIFPIMMVGMLIIRPVKALFTLQQTFKVIEGTHAFGQKFVYFLGQLVNIALALYKCQSMGLLPTHASDWLAFVEPQARVEYSGGGFMYI